MISLLRRVVIARCMRATFRPHIDERPDGVSPDLTIKTPNGYICIWRRGSKWYAHHFDPSHSDTPGAGAFFRLTDERTP